jgi:uncharacterized membrane protein
MTWRGKNETVRIGCNRRCTPCIQRCRVPESARGGQRQYENTLHKELLMTPATSTYRSRFARAVFDLLNPIPYGLFVGTLIFDITYAATGNVFWGKGAAWLVTTGLFFAIIPRLINLCHVWLFSRNRVMRVERVDFWLNLLGIVAAILNAFVHSRDAYAMVPENVVLSVITVALLSIGQFAVAFARFDFKGAAHE